jgi:signal transduction histidine kinase/CheY-like chemotaxis protein
MTYDILYFVIPLLLNVSFGIWILSKRPRMRANQGYFGVAALFVLWGMGEILLRVTDSVPVGKACHQLTNVAGVFLPVVSLGFISACYREMFSRSLPWGRGLFAVYGIATLAGLGIALGTDAILAGASSVGGRVQIEYGAGYFPFFLAVVVLISIPYALIGLMRFRTKGAFLRKQATVLGLAPVLPILAFLLLESLPVFSEGLPLLNSYPATVFFCLIPGITSARLGLMTVTPEKAVRQILAAQPDAVLLTDREGHIRFHNPALVMMSGGRSEDLKAPASVRDLVEIHSPGYENIFDLPFEGLPDLLNLRGELLTSEGGRVPVLATFRKIPGPRGEASGTVLVLRDERPLREIEADMIHLERIHSLGIMVSGVAHELNNPLTAIIGYSELGTQPMDGEQARTYFQTIRTQAQKAHRVIKNLIDFSGSAISYDCPVSLNDLVRGVVRIRKYNFELEGNMLEEVLEDDLPVMQTDPHKLKQITLNLLNNAIQAVEEVPHPGVVRVTTGLRERNVFVSVSDNGPGVPDDVLPEIFNPFYTTKSPGRGTGLGLSISQALVGEMGGRIEVKTQPGRGSTFTVHLPLVEAEWKEKKPPSSSILTRESLPQKPQILVIDDDEAVVDMMVQVLELKGCEVDVARDGEEGLAKVTGGPYDVILCDIRMPRLNGRALINRLRERDPALLRKVVVCSGDMASPETQAFLRQGDLQTLEKPYTLKDLVRTVRRVLRESRSVPW